MQVRKNPKRANKRNFRCTGEDMEIEELFRYMLNFFNNIKNDLQKEVDELSEKDMEINDVLHYLENHTLKSYELAKTGKLLQTLRRERRQIKYNIEIIELFNKFAEKYNNKLITGDIIQVLKDKSRKDKRQNEPVYKYRTNVLERLGAKDEQIQKQENSN